MDILNIATQWAKAEIFSSKFFIAAGLVFIIGAIGFWQLGKTVLSKAYITPLLICGILLLIIGSGLIFNNYRRLKAFSETYNTNKEAFIRAEIERTESTIKQTENTIFKWIPILIIAAAIIIIFTDKPSWRAACITVIAFLIVLLIVDSNSHARIVEYGRELMQGK